MGDLVKMRWNPGSAQWEPDPIAISQRIGAGSPPSDSGAGLGPAAITPRTVFIPKGGRRMYQAARRDKYTADWTSTTTSQDAETASSLRDLRARSRGLMRDNTHAKRAQEVIVNNIVGTGINFQAEIRTRAGRKSKRISSAVEAAFSDWAPFADIAGKLHFSDLERLVMGEVFEAGEILVRFHRTEVPGTRIPFALEVIEPERIADEFEIPAPTDGSEIRLGFKVDRFGRELGVFLKPWFPGDHRRAGIYSDKLEFVPAADYVHLFRAVRSPQTRGIPWIHAAAKRLWDMGEYSDSEMIAARAAANYLGFIETPEDPNDPRGPEDDNSLDLAPGTVETLLPGEKFTGWSPNRPNPNLAPFLDFMARTAAAGFGVSYESLTRDYSKSNYSSTRLAKLEDEDNFRVLQLWFIRAFRVRVHQEFMRLAVLSRSVPAIDLAAFIVDPAPFMRARFRPRGWRWVDPTKEVSAYREAVEAGFTTISDVIAATSGGLDLEDVLEAKKAEMELFEEYGIPYPGAQAPAAKAAIPAPAEPGDDPSETEEPDGEETGDEADRSRIRRVI